MPALEGLSSPRKPLCSPFSLGRQTWTTSANEKAPRTSDADGESILCNGPPGTGDNPHPCRKGNRHRGLIKEIWKDVPGCSGSQWGINAR